ncbi:MAG: transporter substrate-binding domain-containing protein [Herbaspirillum sp.]
MKLKYLIIAIGLLFAALSQAADMKELRIGMEPLYKPFEYRTPDGWLVGFDVDIANALCAEMKMKCVFIAQSFDGLIPALMAKKFDVIISSMTRTEERRKAVAFSEKIYNTPSTIVTRKGSSIDASPASLKGKKVGVLKGSTQEAYAVKVLRPAGATVLSYANTPDSYLDMESARIDAVVADLVEVRSGLLDKPQGKDFAIVAFGLVDPVFANGTGAAVRKQNHQLLEQINAAIKAIRANGTYQRIADKYFDFDVYGQ